MYRDLQSVCAFEHPEVEGEAEYFLAGAERTLGVGRASERVCEDGVGGRRSARERKRRRGGGRCLRAWKRGSRRRWVMVGGGVDLDWGGVKKAGRTARNFGVVALGRYVMEEALRMIGLAGGEGRIRGGQSCRFSGSTPESSWSISLRSATTIPSRPVHP